MIKTTDYFELNDSWVFASLFSYNQTFEPINLVKIIATGDAINHAIFLPKELRQGFKKLQSKGIIEIEEGNIRLTEKGNEIKDKVMNGRGGIFAMVENTLKRINSPRLKIKDIELELEDFLDFLQDEKIKSAYNEYKTAANNVS